MRLSRVVGVVLVQSLFLSPRKDEDLETQAVIPSLMFNVIAEEEGLTESDSSVEGIVNGGNSRIIETLEGGAPEVRQRYTSKSHV